MMRLPWLLLALSIACNPLVPRKNFDDVDPPPAPDYSDDAVWAALPDRPDDADVLAVGEEDGQADAEVDVFFIHPTTLFSGRHWNQPLDHAKTNARTDEAVMRNQASAYNGSGRVFAPRYRQATLGAFLTDRVDESDKALDLAYEDVAAAFDDFLRRIDGRPFVIASHSQGSRHALRLMSERLSTLAADRSLLDRWVASYMVGNLITEDALVDTIPGLPLCGRTGETGCILTWNTIEKDSDPDRFKEFRVWTPDGSKTIVDPKITCTNPILGGSVTEKSSPEQHRGAARFNDELSPEPDVGAITAQCIDGLLEVELLDVSFRTFQEDLHLFDYTLFYIDIRRDLAERVETHLSR